jgi:hypothetical protein
MGAIMERAWVIFNPSLKCYVHDNGEQCWTYLTEFLRCAKMFSDAEKATYYKTDRKICDDFIITEVTLSLVNKK